MIARLRQILHARLVSIFMLVATALVLLQIISSTIIDTIFGIWFVGLVWLALKMPRVGASKAKDTAGVSLRAEQ